LGRTLSPKNLRGDINSIYYKGGYPPKGSHIYPIKEGGKIWNLNTPFGLPQFPNQIKRISWFLRIFGIKREQ